MSKKRKLRRIREAVDGYWKRNIEKGILCINPRTQLWECVYPLTQQRLVIILIQMKADKKKTQQPTVIAAEAQEIFL